MKEGEEGSQERVQAGGAVEDFKGPTNSSTSRPNVHKGGDCPNHSCSLRAEAQKVPLNVE